MSDLKYMLEAKAAMLYDKMCFYKGNWKPIYEEPYNEANKLLEETLLRIEEIDRQDI